MLHRLDRAPLSASFCLALLAVSTTAASAAPPPCMRWDNGLDCADFGGCTSDAEWRFYYSQLFTATPGQAGAQESCEKYFDVFPNPPATVEALPTQWADSYGCYLDGQSFPSHVVNYRLVTQETMCFRTPAGPYQHLGTTGTAGATFSSYKVGRVISANRSRNNQSILSDYKFDYFRLLVSGGFWQVDNSANVDHIIPRKDIYGCECGPDSYANALVISRKLNLEMSNFPNHPSRLDILNRYTQ